MTPPVVRIRLYPLIVRAVEDGAAYGIRRAHKYTDAPSADMIKTEIENAVVNELCELFDFDAEQTP